MLANRADSWVGWVVGDGALGWAVGDGNPLLLGGGVGVAPSRELGGRRAVGLVGGDGAGDEDRGVASRASLGSSSSSASLGESRRNSSGCEDEGGNDLHFERLSD